MIISSVANEIPDRIARLVYLDALVPEDGESVLDVLPVTRGLVDFAAQSDIDWRVPPLPEMPPPAGLLGVTDPADVAWTRTMLSDEPVLCFQQPVRLDNPALNTIPRTHIHCVGDETGGAAPRPVSPVQPNGDPAQVWGLTSGHCCMISMPAELAELLLKLG